MLFLFVPIKSIEQMLVSTQWKNMNNSHIKFDKILQNERSLSNFQKYPFKKKTQKYLKNMFINYEINIKK